jgi:hypothetical protein
MSNLKRPKYIVLFTAVALLTLIGAACNYHGDATVGCSQVGKLLTGMGMLNSPKVLLGNIEALDPATKRVAFAMRLSLNDGDAEVVPEADSTDISDASNLNITFAGKISELPQSLQVQLSSQIAQSLQLHVENSHRSQLDRPVDVLNRAGNKQSILDLMNANPSQIYVLVFGGVATTRVTFQKKVGTENSFSITFGKDTFSGNVNYSCQGDLTEVVNAANVAHTLTFFKVLQITKTGVGDLTVSILQQNVADYDWTQALKLS